jgi:hypothetical protein
MNLLNKLVCFFMDHEYYVVQVFTNHSCRVACGRCKRSWGMHDELRGLIEWDERVESFYRDCGHRIIKPWR